MKKNIGKIELFSLTLLFIIGNTGLYALGVDIAKQDAWISILLAMLLSYILLWIYLKLQSYFPNDNLALMIIKSVEKPIAYTLVIFYSIYFFYIALLNFSMFVEFIRFYLLPQTSKLTISVLLLINIFYINSLGIEVIARLAGLMAPLFILFVIIIYSLIFSSGIVNFQNLQPFLGNGITAVVDAAIPELLIFPFADMVLLLMIWEYVKIKKSISQISFLAMTLGGVIITFALIIIIGVLGVNWATIANVANMAVSQLINIGYLKNIDVIIVIVLFLLGFFKMIPFLFGSISLVNSLLNLHNNIWVNTIFSIFLLIFNYAPFTGVEFYSWINSFDRRTERIMEYIHISFQMLIPTFLLIITWLKRIRK
ncbi:GerAB/ArcD/ProY family transporter [Orenia marismortui]|uniref:Spore germination protein KB n=1 Tax=Orenia marismortui TaxID=46469 RepID=A0A4R8GZU6_9FIRM|nr:GerAB/ArcD/ProY family transporter [Orenia marismortui]TDX52380.1 spore germination protein KB [Orenia marismortui]